MQSKDREPLRLAHPLQQSEIKAYELEIESLKRQSTSLSSDNFSLKRRLAGFDQRKETSDHAASFPKAADSISGEKDEAFRLLEAENQATRQIVDRQNGELQSLHDECARIKSERVETQIILKALPEDVLKRPDQFLNSFELVKKLRIELDAANHSIEKYQRELRRLFADKNTELNKIEEECELKIESIINSFKSSKDETNRLRQERDKMRKLYEESNLSLSSMIKKHSNGQRLLEACEKKTAALVSEFKRTNLIVESLNDLVRTQRTVLEGCI